MDFGYFTLSDNHYENNTRAANQFISDIPAEALYAEQVGMHSAWIGEHHFNSLGVLSCPDLVLAWIAARTRRIRLAPAVTVLPLRAPIRVAEQWATLDLEQRPGRFCCRAWLRSARVSAIPRIVRGQPVHLRGGSRARAQVVGRRGRISHHGKHYQFDDVGSLRHRLAASSPPTSVRSPSPRSSSLDGSAAD